MFHTIPVALSMPMSNKGDWMAFSAASLALVLPTKENHREKYVDKMIIALVTEYKFETVHLYWNKKKV